MAKEKKVATTQVSLFTTSKQRGAVWQQFYRFLKEFAHLTSRIYFIRVMLLLAVYIITARIGFSLFTTDHAATFIWLPMGISFASLFLWGTELWPAIAIGSFVIRLSLGIPILSAVGIAFGSTIAVLVGIDVLHRYVPIDPSFRRLRDALYFFTVTLFITTITASIGTGSLLFGRVITNLQFSHVWVAWWVGDLLSVLLVTPLILVWCSPAYVSLSWKKVGESIVLFTTLIGLSFLIFWTNIQQLELFPIIYLLFIPLMWAALRSSQRGITAALFTMSFITISATLLHQGAFAGIPTYQALLSLQLFLGFMVIIFVSFTAIAEEQKTLARTLEHTVEKLDDAVQRLNAEDKIKNEFIATLAHEVRNPLAPILSYLEIAKIEASKLQQPTLAEPLDVMGRHLRTIVKLLEDLLDIARISSKKLKLNLESVQVQDLIQHCIETIADSYASRRHTLVTEIPRDPIWIQVDPLRFEQVINNLLYNAAKYTNPGGRMELSIQTHDKELRIALKDNGLGIEPQLLKKIFEPFRQGTITTPVGTGLGIGLSLSKQLVELHHGKIWAESKGSGHGSTFWVVFPLPKTVQLPMVTPMRYTDKGKVDRRKKSRGKKYNVLIVDDNIEAALSLQKLLAHNEHATEVAHTAAEALEKLHTFGADIALLDIGLPDMDGYQLARKIRENQAHKDLTLIALTGYGQQEDKLKAKQAGFDHHLTKPVSIGDLQKLFDSLEE